MLWNKIHRALALHLIVLLALLEPTNALMNRVELNRPERKEQWIISKLSAEMRVKDTPQAKYIQGTQQCGRDPTAMDYMGWMKTGQHGKIMNTFFWHWEAQSMDPEAPIVLYVNPEPGLAATSSIFDETGPCRFHKLIMDPLINPWSYTRDVDMLYVDVLNPTGFTTGDYDISTTKDAVDHLYRFLQLFILEFPQFANRKFGIWGVSYGGHFAISLAKFILEQNKEIAKFPRDAKHINLQSLGLDSPIIDLAIQREDAIAYAYKNRLRKIITRDIYKYHKAKFAGIRQPLESCMTGNDPLFIARTKVTADHPSTRERCKDVLQKFQMLTHELMERARKYIAKLKQPLDPRNILIKEVLHHPANSTYMGALWLNDKVAQFTMGMNVFEAEYKYRLYEGIVNVMFDDSLDVLNSSMHDLEFVVDHGLRTLIMGGNGDLIASPNGLKECARRLVWDKGLEFMATKDTDLMSNVEVLPLKKSNFTGYLVKPGDSSAIGTKRSAGVLTWMNVREAGHHVGRWQPSLAVQIFREHVWGQEMPVEVVKKRHINIPVAGIFHPLCPMNCRLDYEKARCCQNYNYDHDWARRCCDLSYDATIQEKLDDINKGLYEVEEAYRKIPSFTPLDKIKNVTQWSVNSSNVTEVENMDYKRLFEVKFGYPPP